MSDLSNSIRNLLTAGYTYSQITKELNCTKSTVSYHAKQLGIAKGPTLQKTKIPRNSWDKEKCIVAIQRFVFINGRIPESREFNKVKEYPNFSTIQHYFGSWNKGIEAAGFTANYNDGLGVKTLAKDGILYRSQAEAYFVDKYLYGKYQYEYEKPYGNGWLFDFYLPEHNLYIEIDGGIRPQRIEEKIFFCQKNNIKLLVISKEDLHKQNYALVV